MTNSFSALIGLALFLTVFFFLYLRSQFYGPLGLVMQL